MKRTLYEVDERVTSATQRLRAIASSARILGHHTIASEINEVIARDLSEAKEKIEYAQAVAND